MGEKISCWRDQLLSQKSGFFTRRCAVRAMRDRNKPFAFAPESFSPCPGIRKVEGQPTATS